MKKTSLSFMIGFLSAALIFSTIPVIASSIKQVTATVTEFNIMINNESIDIEDNFLAYNGKSYLPVRAITEAMGYDVDYDENTRTILLSNKTELTNQITANNDDGKTKNHVFNVDVVEGLGDMYRDSDNNLDLQAIKDALASGDISVDSVDENGNTLLMIAAKRLDDYYVGEYLINKGADLNHQNNDGQTAVHIAAIEKNSPFLKLLLASGASIDIEDNNNKKPIDYTTKYSSQWLILDIHNSLYN